MSVISEDTAEESAATNGKPAAARPRIFIVYENHEQQLAQALQDLLVKWGFHAFFCRQEIRELAASEPYRKELAEELAHADLVILILSNGFQNSQYCQAEAGATVTYRKHQIQITIPPVDADRIKRVSPVLEGWELIDGGKPEDFVRLLRNKLRGEFSDRGMLVHKDAAADLRSTEADKVRASLVEVVKAYRSEPPTQALIGVWDSLTDQRTGRSIITNIRRAVVDGETNIAVIGVSLKFSINIITEAINNLVASPPGESPARGPLTIELFHVDDQSHILHSLEDTIDIRSVLDYLRVGWAERKADWEAKCARAGITVNVADPVAIDYIPQQVGIRIKSITGEWSVLYAGRCSFERAGTGTRLLVGEGEYFFTPPRRAICAAQRPSRCSTSTSRSTGHRGTTARRWCSTTSSGSAVSNRAW